MIKTRQRITKINTNKASSTPTRQTLTTRDSRLRKFFEQLVKQHTGMANTLKSSRPFGRAFCKVTDESGAKQQPPLGVTAASPCCNARILRTEPEASRAFGGADSKQRGGKKGKRENKLTHTLLLAVETR